MKREWDVSFIKGGELSIEGCPQCGEEVECTLNGKCTCPYCGWEEILPCSACQGVNQDQCDWNPLTGCTPFREEVTWKKWNEIIINKN